MLFLPEAMKTPINLPLKSAKCGLIALLKNFLLNSDAASRNQWILNT